MKKALLIIDMQTMPFVWKDYGGKALYHEERLLVNTRLLIDRARQAQSPIFYVLHTETTGPRSVDQPLWEIVDPVAPAPEDFFIIKYHADSFHETDLHMLLCNNGVKGLVICGIQTDYCVDTTVKRAYSYGYEVELASDCTSTFDSDELTAEQIIRHHHHLLQQFASLLPSDQVVFKA
ncbi:cysteine hydrolase family protein [Gracilibacillus xinjiangensis]|uniref:Cysteine hydrolase family protein n=1 Tax=Gracilibacillus xinjiangensis TaxID=1193282 RepID=A0ABV8WUX7_9BACI